MDFIKNFDPTPAKLLKLAAVLIVALIVLALAAQMFAPSFPLAIMPHMGQTDGSYPREFGISYSTDYADGGSGYATAKQVSPSMMGYAESAGTPSLSARNVAPIISTSPGFPPTTRPTAIDPDAEKYEVTEYSASIETRKRDTTCAAFHELKSKDYVVFENSDAYDRGCSFTFKVAQAHVNEVLAWLKQLDPKYLNENTYTIKRQIDDFTSEEEILKKKLTQIDNTLKSATSAYDEVTRLATQTKDAASLSSIIQSRIQIIQQLTQERLSINEQLDRLSRAKVDQLDHLDYTYFRVDVTENKYIDTRALAESWKQALRDVVRVINDAVQGVTINLIALFFIVLQWALYALILLVIAKYGWNLAVKIWKR